MISTDAFANTFGAVAAGDTEKLVKLAVLAVRNGFAVVLNHPGTKKPLCTLVARAAKLADMEAQALAKEAGDSNWQRRRHACGIAHAFTDSASVAKVIRRLVKNEITPNLGVEVGRSRMVVVDVDTAAEKDAFLAQWTENSDRDMTSMAPTVVSPGAKVDGRWVHKDGGHFWFTLPEGYDLPDSGGVLRGEGGWSVLWRGKQVLVPPSSRDEGTYRLVGQSSELPAWLREFIRRGAASQAEKRTAAAVSARTADPISAWASDKTWSDILTPDGWTDTGKADNCGCPIWTAPGDHASPKSATAHEAGCSQYDTSMGQAPIHIWTDNIPECVDDVVTARGRTFSKFHYLVFRLYGGDQARAKSEMGINDEVLGAFDAVDAPAFSPENAEDERPAAEADDDDPSDFGLPSGDGGAAAPAGGGRPPQNPTVLPDEFWDARPELEHIRQAARSKIIPPDAVLQGVLVRLAAMVPGTLKVDTEILKPVSLNHFAALVAPSGVGKSSSVHLASEILALVPGLDGLFARPIGSGEGLAESYMGNREEGTGEVYASGPRQGEEKTRIVRAQTSHNSLFYLDEGETLAKLMAERSGATLGQQLRTAWGGDTLGQANGTAERTRIVNDYAMGLLIGYQPETAYSLLDGVMQGTPQRFIWSRVTDPALPDDLPGWPGPLDLDLGVLLADPSIEEEPRKITVCHEIKRGLVEIQMSRARGKLTEDEQSFNSQRQASLIKLSGLLAVLAGRGTICVEDWELAKIIWKVSAKIRDALLAARARDEAKRQEDRTERDVKRAVAVATATGVLDVKVERVAKNLVRWVKKEGPQKQGYLNSKIKYADRPHIPDAIEHALDMEWLTRGDDETLCLGTESPA
jgi:hypothetical protein